MVGRWRALTTGGAVVGCWYGGHLLFSIGMKHSVACVADVARLTSAQLALGAAVLSAGYGLRLIPAVPWWLWWQGTPQGLLFLAGSLCTNTSLTLLAVSFAYLLKAIEPFFTMALVWAVDGTPPSALQFFSLVLASTGLMLTGCAQRAMHTPSRHADAPATDATAGEYAGVVLALLSNLLLQLRNVLNKQLLRPPPTPDVSRRTMSTVPLIVSDTGSPCSNGSPFPLREQGSRGCAALALATAPLARELSHPTDPEAARGPQPLQVLLVSFVTAAAAQLLLDTLSHSVLYPGALMGSLGITSPPLSTSTAAKCAASRPASLWVLATPACFLLYQVASILVLGEVEPVVHAALNSLKRAMVVVASAMLMHEPVSVEYLVGGAATLIGVSALSSATKLAKPHAGARPAGRRLCCLLLSTQIVVLFTAGRLLQYPGGPMLGGPSRLPKPVAIGNHTRHPRNATRAAVRTDVGTSDVGGKAGRKRMPYHAANASRIPHGADATDLPRAAPRPAAQPDKEAARASGRLSARPLVGTGSGGGGVQPSEDAARLASRLPKEAPHPRHAAQQPESHPVVARVPTVAAKDGQGEGRPPRADAGAERGAEGAKHKAAGRPRAVAVEKQQPGRAEAVPRLGQRV